MKKYLGCLILLLPILFAGCSDDDEPSGPLEPRVVLTVKVDASFNANVTVDNWMMITDIDGNLIDYKAFVAGDSLSFETAKATPSDKINITIAETSGNSTGRYHYLRSYLWIPIGQNWTIKEVLS